MHVYCRCGDVLEASLDNWEYGLLPFRWVYDMIPATTKRVYVCGNFQGPKCSKIRSALLNYLRSQKRKFSTVEFISQKGAIEGQGQGALQDFLFLTRARNIVGSDSTFALVASWLNAKGNTTLPCCHLFGLGGCEPKGSGAVIREPTGIGGVTKTAPALYLPSTKYRSWKRRPIAEIIKILSIQSQVLQIQVVLLQHAIA